MRRLMIVSFLLLATAASAGDWWVQAFGEATWALTTKGTYGVDIENDTVSEENLKPPVAKPYLGGGLMIGSSSDDGRRVFGVVVDYLTGTRTTGLTIVDPVLGWGDIVTDSSALQVSLFFAGLAPFLSSDSGSWRGYLGGGLGMLSPSGEVRIDYREVPVEGGFNDVSESKSIGGSMFMIDLFVMEEWNFSDTFGLAATLGFRGVPFKDTEVSTGTMTGTYRSQYTGPYLRAGLRYDI